MKSPMSFWRVVAEELGHRCCVNTERDFKTVAARTNTEGLSFLTITLPNFGKDFDEALAVGKVDHDHFAGFKRCGGLPRFLGGFLDLVFDRDSGVLLAEASTGAVLAIRQLTRLFSKIELKCSDERERAAFRKYLAIEEELEAAPPFTADTLMGARFGRMAKLLFGNVLARVDRLCADPLTNLFPKHGPGATADLLRGNHKYIMVEWTERLERAGVCSTDFLLPNARYIKHLETVEFLAPDAERPVKVIGVPKTLVTPRIIAVEPTCMQYVQQAIAVPLVRALEGDPLVGPMIGFTDQDPNRKMARRGSIDGSLATLDLSDASDRVTNAQKLLLFKGFTHLQEVSDACRSTRARVPGHGVIPLTKFASMGSALCFPVEAMVFLTVAFLGIERARGHQIRKSDLESFHGTVRVFGDDIIVPGAYAHSVFDELEAFGFRVNRHKSFLVGNFRESCGKEYFKGQDVSIVKVRQAFPSERKHVKQIVSTVSLRNQLFEAGFESPVSWLDDVLTEILKWFPEVEPTSPVLGRWTYSGASPDGFSSRLHRPTVRGWIKAEKLPESRLDGPGALLKFFLKQGDLPVFDRKHLERAGRPLVVGIKLANGPVR